MVQEIEIQLVIAMRPSRRALFQKMENEGYTFRVQTVSQTPERVMEAVQRLSHETQHDTIVPWLENLLRREELPVFSEEETRAAEEKGINLYEEIQVLLSQRYEFKKIVCIPDTPALMDEVNADRASDAIDFFIQRVLSEYEKIRTPIPRLLFNGMCIIGPIAAVLGYISSRTEMIFAALVTGASAEVVTLFALKRSGFTRRQLLRRSRFFLFACVLTALIAFQVETYVRRGEMLRAGCLFGVSLAIFSTCMILQVLYRSHQTYRKLLGEGKIRLTGAHGLWWFVFQNYFSFPLRRGVCVGVVSACVIPAVLFWLLPSWVHSGWLLAFIGVAPAIVANLTVLGTPHLDRWLAARRMRRELNASISSAFQSS